MKNSEKFSRLTEERIREILEEITQRENLPVELLNFDYERAAKILCISVRTLKKNKKEGRISFSQSASRSRVTFSASDLIDYVNSIKTQRS